MDTGVDETRCDRVDANALLGDLFGEAQGEAVDRTLGAGIPDIGAGAAEGGGAGGQVDDGAASAAVAGRHAPHRLAAAPHGAEVVDLHHPADVVGCSRVEAPGRPREPGVVDKGGDGAEGCFGRLEQTFDLRIVGDVGLQSHGAAALGLDVGRHGLGPRPVAAKVERQREAASGSEARRGGADTPAGAGDDQDLTHGPLRSLPRHASNAD